MKNLFTRPRLAIFFAVIGMLLMGVDLLITRDVFAHVGELMVLSLLCLVTALVIDREPQRTNRLPSESGNESEN
ncbi:hypothetical protein SAMN05660860_00449 [Geoalkalibacter ferrihydriticus]|uniref:Uncharacterized protein n=2 Tax=Geoalkalibacter ferrihydriticus TaxID=392333 RepID=A0A0C2HQ95_9BACT|nr:hypothetical protein [Geoalkalibacter ferrihydriticus]KIH77060.1 hypothetical protein GFER_08450 [Geoalkalibacter ferrihydriticus DSM 17813]SDL36824.1 hypothetical protein SAMN05660860_00449 [Geoalkalibacter ferrihydriticus]